MDLTKFIKTKNADALADSDRLNVLFASSEVAPFSKTGGLGDVAASLPKALASRGHRISIITPLYGHLDPAKMSLARRLQPLSVPRKGKSQQALDVTVWEGRLDSGVRIFFIEAEEYFGRSGVYGYNGDTFKDNAERFAFFSRAVVEFVNQFGVAIDVVHCNDWHTSLTPVYMNHYYKSEMAKIGTVLTLHNAAYQGTFDKSQFEATGLPKTTFLTDAKLQQNGEVNFLKGGILYSDWVTAVSPTYSKELRTEAGGFGLEDLFKEKGEQLQGILNGADYSIWSPERDHHIAVRYDQERLNGKRQNKAELQHEFGLPVRPVLPLVGFVGRLTEQKGLDLLIPTVRTLLKAAKTEREGFQMVFLGDGDAKYQKALEKLVSEFPSRVGVRFGYDDERAHRIFAGVDILAVPSEYEPCGLTQIYAMKYGTIPVVHAVGGLADTVVDADADAEKGTGFVFDKYTKAGVTSALSRAVEKYRHHRQWRPLMINAMNADFSWSQSAQEYEALYLRVRDAKSPRKKSTAKKTAPKSSEPKSTVEDSTDATAAKKTTAKKPAAKKPAAKKPAAKKAAEKPAVVEEKPAAEKKPAAKKPAAKKPAAKKPAAKKPAAKKPAAEKAEPKKPAPKKATSPKSKKT